MISKLSIVALAATILLPATANAQQMDTARRITIQPPQYPVASDRFEYKSYQKINNNLTYPVTNGAVLMAPGESRQFPVIIKNDGTDPLTITGHSFVDFTHTDEGGHPIFDVSEELRKSGSFMSNWAAVDFDTATLQAGEFKAGNILINLPVAAPSGDYQMCTRFPISWGSAAQGTGNFSSSIEVASSATNCMVVRVQGDIKESATLISADIDKERQSSGFVTFNYALDNTGTANLRPWGLLRIRDENGQLLKGIFESRQYDESGRYLRSTPSDTIQLNLVQNQVIFKGSKKTLVEPWQYNIQYGVPPAGNSCTKGTTDNNGQCWYAVSRTGSFTAEMLVAYGNPEQYACKDGSHSSKDGAGAECWAKIPFSIDEGLDMDFSSTAPTFFSGSLPLSISLKNTGSVPANPQVEVEMCDWLQNCTQKISLFNENLTIHTGETFVKSIDVPQIKLGMGVYHVRAYLTMGNGPKQPIGEKSGFSLSPIIFALFGGILAGIAWILFYVRRLHAKINNTNRRR